MNFSTTSCNVYSIYDAYKRGIKLNSLIVSAYYKISNKRDSNEFVEWIKNFFYLKNPKVIYTNQYTFDDIFFKLYGNNLEKIESKEDNKNENVYIFHQTNSLFIIQEFEDMFIWKNYKNLMEYSETIYTEILQEINHNKYLYTIWNNKTYWLKETSEFIDSDSYYWTDIGCIRYESTPEIQSFVSKLDFVNRTDKNMIFGVVGIFFQNDLKNFKNNIPLIFYNNGNVIRLEGTFFGGGKHELLEWCELYTDELNLFEKFKVFSGKDQNIMGLIVIKNMNKFDYFILDRYIDTKNNIHLCDEVWFRFLKIFG